jgi:hypothetical protein
MSVSHREYSVKLPSILFIHLRIKFTHTYDSDSNFFCTLVTCNTVKTNFRLQCKLTDLFYHLQFSPLIRTSFRSLNCFSLKKFFCFIFVYLLIHVHFLMPSIHLKTLKYIGFFILLHVLSTETEIGKCHGM